MRVVPKYKLEVSKIEIVFSSNGSHYHRMEGKYNKESWFFEIYKTKIWSEFGIVYDIVAYPLIYTFLGIFTVDHIDIGLITDVNNPNFQKMIPIIRDQFYEYICTYGI